ncbi:N-acetyl-gamma-glutamyl-phosphate reductase [uncultured Dubosiella sp.]|uniref:N-acetyl-gamma-glutamyl-phosphate reductase n=1 Tax=uncultured Dubosiella sp. TaxID=1937011 RepID=UPI002630A701|nr:N-acetyl-gamma-glutamyl-phosphate reductase [uncultured Dubosiella sp.]
MNKPKVYIDGQAGTTGLQIYERLKNREDIELLLIQKDKRKDNTERRKMFEKADLSILCLPDQAAIEAAELAKGTKTKLVDASTAHRTQWTYGFPELSKIHRQKIKEADHVANPGCHATGFISIVYPLVQAGLIQPDQIVHAFSLTGYSGGGKKMISQYENKKDEELFAPRIYGLTMNHKHLPEMKKICGLDKEPLFTPVVDDYFNGMLVSVQISQSVQKVLAVFKEAYNDEPLIEIVEQSENMLSANEMKNSDHLKIYVNGNDHSSIISASFDNLGKGACGAAIQNMNLMLGFPEMTGLR